MVELDSYWKRKKVEPYKPTGKQWELHMRLDVGAFVQILGNSETSFMDPGNICYLAIGINHWDSTDVVSEKLFNLYFEPVTSKSELGLIKLAEMDR